MRSYSKVERFLWRDPRFFTLTEDAQKLWLYLLTSPQATACPGLFVAPPLVILNDMAWIKQSSWLSEGNSLAFSEANVRLKEAFEQLEKMGWVAYDIASRVVLVPSAPRHNMPESRNVAIAWARSVMSIPACHLRDKWIEIASKILNENANISLKEAFTHALRKALPSQEVSLSEAPSEALALPSLINSNSNSNSNKKNLERLASEATLPLALDSEQVQSMLSEQKKKNTYHEDADRLARYMLSIIIELKPDTRQPTETAFNGWVRDMHRLLVLDKRDPMRVRAVIDWATHDDFWAANIRSPGKLREQFDKLELQMGRVRKSVPPRVRDEANPDRALPYYEDVEAKMRRAGFGGDQ